MSGSARRVDCAFRHTEPDRTPLFEIYQHHHPLHWDVCGRNPATDEAMYYDAAAEGIDWRELVEMQARAKVRMAQYFGLDVVHVGMNPTSVPVVEKLGSARWRTGGIDYVLDERTKLVVVENPAALHIADSEKITEEDRRREIEQFDGTRATVSDDQLILFRRVKELSAEIGADWTYMAEGSCGTGVAFYPPFQLMWLVLEPELVKQFIEMQKAQCFPKCEAMLREGAAIYSLGGDVSSDKGPMLSPAQYREFILPAIQEHVELIHKLGGRAVYTSDGNHWAIKDDMFFHSGVDGYKEVDQAAGMTFPRLIEEGVAEKVCIVGNMDARYMMCNADPSEVVEATRQCLDWGRQSPGGHILHLSHSVHEDVKCENYRAMVNTYREYFGMEKLA